jgi:hypothetical protein
MQNEQTVWMIRDHRDHTDGETLDVVFSERKDVEQYIMDILVDWEGYVGDYEVACNTGTYSNYDTTLVESDIQGSVFSADEVEVR